MDTGVEDHVAIVTIFVGPADVSNDGFDGILVSVGLSDPVDEYGTVEELVASDKPWIIILCISHPPKAGLPPYFRSLLFLLYLRWLPLSPTIVVQVHHFFVD